MKRTREERMKSCKVPTITRPKIYENQVLKCLGEFWELIERVPNQSAKETLLRHILKTESLEEVQKIREMGVATPIDLVKRIDLYARKLEKLFEMNKESVKRD